MKVTTLSGFQSLGRLSLAWITEWLYVKYGNHVASQSCTLSALGISSAILFPLRLAMQIELDDTRNLSFANPMPGDIFRQTQTKYPEHVLALCSLGQTLPPIPSPFFVRFGLHERSTAAHVVAHFGI